MSIINFVTLLKIQMNKTLIEFFEGNIKDASGRLLSEIRSQTDKWLEEQHDYIQWLFPNREASAFNPNAPLLDDETVEVFRSRNDLQLEVAQNLDRMIKFYQLDDETIERPWWVTKGNHNYLRITRILNTLREFRMVTEAVDFFDKLSIVYINNRDIIRETTLDYWEKALVGEIDE